jgi:hypothetical protein
LQAADFPSPVLALDQFVIGVVRMGRVETRGRQKCFFRSSVFAIQGVHWGTSVFAMNAGCRRLPRPALTQIKDENNLGAKGT